MNTPTLELTDKEGIRVICNLPSVRMVDDLRRKRKIPCVKLGYRTIRFDPAKVVAALEKLTVREVGAQ